MLYASAEAHLGGRHGLALAAELPVEPGEHVDLYVGDWRSRVGHQQIEAVATSDLHLAFAHWGRMAGVAEACRHGRVDFR
jgi:hypothetical protein